eukprot:3345543-Pleurochrysis_carterae.AAC.1
MMLRCLLGRSRIIHVCVSQKLIRIPKSLSACGSVRLNVCIVQEGDAEPTDGTRVVSGVTGEKIYVEQVRDFAQMSSMSRSPFVWVFKWLHIRSRKIRVELACACVFCHSSDITGLNTESFLLLSSLKVVGKSASTRVKEIKRE